MRRLRRWFWSAWDGRFGTVAMSIIAFVSLFVLGRELDNAFRLAFGTLFGAGIGWRVRRHIDTAAEKRREATWLARTVAHIRHFAVGNGEGR